MTGKDLFEGMSWVDEGFIDEAEHAAFPKPRVVPWIRIASMAACLCLILFAIPYLLPLPENPRSPEDTAPHGSLEDPQESQHSNILAPEDPPTGEIPNVILYVEEMTAEGFIGTVTDYGVTDRLGLGTRLNMEDVLGMDCEKLNGFMLAYIDKLLNLRYDPMRVCRCAPGFEVGTEFGGPYGINLSNAYARCEDAQAELTEEQVERIRQILENQTSLYHQGAPASLAPSDCSGSSFRMDYFTVRFRRRSKRAFIRQMPAMT